MKILANVLGTQLLIPQTEEGPGYGAAQLAKKACDPTYAFQSNIDIKEVIVPDKTLTSLYQEKYDKFSKIYPSVKELYKNI